MDKDAIANARSIPLPLVLEQLGAERDPKDPERNWRLGASRITVTDFRFYDHNAAGAIHRMRGGKPGGGGAIDLVQYLKDVSFGEAVAHLINTPRAFTAAVVPPNSLRQREESAALPPTPNGNRLARVRWYLKEVRAIPDSIVEAAISTQSLFADVRGNVVFRLQNMTGANVGYELRGTGDRPFHSVSGEKGLYIAKADSTRRAVFVESGIEALSYQSLKPVGLIVSTTGSAIDLPAKMSQALSARGFEIVAAFNADTAGDHMSERLAKESGVAVRRERPPEGQGKDWNDNLRESRSGELRNNHSKSHEDEALFR